MAVIATVVRSAVLQHELRAAFRDQHTLFVCDDWAALTRACDERPVQLVLFDLYEHGVATFDQVRTLRVRYPRLAFVAYCNADQAHPRDLFDAGRAGIDALAIQGEDDRAERLQQLVERAEARSVAAQIRALVADEPALVRDAVLASVTRAHERLTPEGLARLLLVPRRVLSRRLEECAYPPPQQLITWGRLIVAAHLLEDPERTAESVAHALDFASGSAFRNLCRRYLDATPAEIRAGGGGSWAVDRFAQRRTLDFAAA